MRRIIRYGGRFAWADEIVADEPSPRVIARRINDKARRLIWLAIRGEEVDFTDVFGFAASDFRLHMERQFVGSMTWETYGWDGWHVEHIIPLSSFSVEAVGSQEFRSAWALSNLRPLFKEDNLRKGQIRRHLL